MKSIIYMFKYFWKKLIFTIPVGVFTISQEHYAVIWGLVFIITLDTILGLWVSFKHKVFASYKLGRIATKISKYFIAMASVWVLSTVSPIVLGWTFHGLGIFLIMTEVFSNFEKLAILGFEIPTKFLAKINKDFHDYYFGNDFTSKTALKRILNKEQATCRDDGILDNGN